MNYLRSLVKRFGAKFYAISPEAAWFAAVTLTAAVVRLIFRANTPVITPDGTLYIGRAKAIFYGQCDVIAECRGFRRLSLYHAKLL